MELPNGKGFIDNERVRRMLSYANFWHVEPSHLDLATFGKTADTPRLTYNCIAQVYAGAEFDANR